MSPKIPWIVPLCGEYPFLALVNSLNTDICFGEMAAVVGRRLRAFLTASRPWSSEFSCRRASAFLAPGVVAWARILMACCRAARASFVSEDSDWYLAFSLDRMDVS